MTVRVRMKRHPSGVCVAHIAIPTRVGTITVGGFGDFLSDALNAASKVSHRITSDPVISAILPPQATAALAAVNAIADAANHSPEALKAELDQHSGPGKVRLVKALHAEATALDNGATPAAAARAATAAVKPTAATATATADNTSSGSRGLPSFLGDMWSDLNARLQAQINRAHGVSSDHRKGSLTPAKPSPRRTQAAPTQPSRNHQGRGDDDMAAHNHGHKAPDQRPDDYEDDDGGNGDDGQDAAQPQYADDGAPQSTYSPQAYADDVRAQREADERVQRYADAEAQTRAMFGEGGDDGAD